MGSRRKRGRSVHGIVLLDKATGCSSNHALQRVKRLFNAQKAGHTGSLDPLATGMLPICFGEATKISSFLLDANKTYLTDAHLGVRTNSGDADGEIISTSAVAADLSPEKINAVLQTFCGEIDQIPPMYSAISINGQRLYKLARQGIEVERPARRVTIHALELEKFDGQIIRLRVRCSKGTYIRSLVEGIGEKLGCGAHVATLRRESVEPFDYAAMVTEGQLSALADAAGEKALDCRLLPLDSALNHLPRVEVSADSAKAFQQGQKIQVLLPEIVNQPPAKQESARIYAESRMLGLGSIDSHGAELTVQPIKVFNW